MRRPAGAAPIGRAGRNEAVLGGATAAESPQSGEGPAGRDDRFAMNYDGPSSRSKIA